MDKAKKRRIRERYLRRVQMKKTKQRKEKEKKRREEVKMAAFWTWFEARVDRAAKAEEAWEKKQKEKEEAGEDSGKGSEDEDEDEVKGPGRQGTERFHRLRRWGKDKLRFVGRRRRTGQLLLSV
jgi:hypothetical protein